MTTAGSSDRGMHASSGQFDVVRRSASSSAGLQAQPRWLHRRASPATAPALGNSRILFVDSGSENVPAIISAAAGRMQIVLLDSKSDGVGQMVQYLHGRNKIGLVMIAAADETGSLGLGSTHLTVANLYAFEDELRSIGRALAPAGQVRLLGRGLRTDRSDGALLVMLSRLSGVDFVASAEPAHLQSSWALPWTETGGPNIRDGGRKVA